MEEIGKLFITMYAQLGILDAVRSAALIVLAAFGVNVLLGMLEE